jgi:hypothetical protein
VDHLGLNTEYGALGSDPESHKVLSKQRMRGSILTPEAWEEMASR